MTPHALNILLMAPVLVACATQVPPERDNIPRQLAEDLAGGQIYVDLPDGFPTITLPDNILTEGGLDRGSAMTLILKSELSTERMETAIRTELVTSGWAAFNIRPMPQRGGFIGNTTPFQGRFSDNQFCHDNYGMMSINARSRQGIYNRLALDWNYSTNMSGLTCAQQIEQRQGAMSSVNPMAGLNEQMPVLELPAENRGVRFRPPFGGGGISSSGNVFTTQSPLHLDWSMAEIKRWFARQLEEQGWEQDASWEGERTAGSTWDKRDDDETELVGLLDITKVEDNTFHLHFRLSYRNQ